MPKHLLTAQTLLSLCGEPPNAAADWFAGQSTDELRVSVISIARASDAIMQVADATDRTRLDAALSWLLAALESDAGPPLAFEAGHAKAWQALISEPTLKGMGVSERQVYATALHDGLVVVDEAGTYTRAARALGIRVHEL